MIDRRELIQRMAAVMGGTLSSSAAAGVLSGCVAMPAPQAKPAPPRFFTAGEQATAAVVAEHIIPRTDTPGAIDLGVPAFMDRMLADFYLPRTQSVVRAGLARIDGDAQAAQGKPFVALTSEQQVAQLNIYDAEQYAAGRRPATSPDPHFFRIMKELTTVGFFTTEVGATKILRYDPTPGPFHGDIPLAQVGRSWAS
jgi:hypothetical protein